MYDFSINGLAALVVSGVITMTSFRRNNVIVITPDTTSLATPWEKDNGIKTGRVKSTGFGTRNEDLFDQDGPKRAKTIK